MDPVIKEHEQKHLTYVTDTLKNARTELEKSLNNLGEENLARLKDLRTDPEGSADFAYLIEQLHEKNQAFGLKERFKRLEEMDFLSKEPYFARIDLTELPEASHEVEEIYIGKFGFSFDKPVVTDWRAPIASVYYRYRYPQKDVQYTSPQGLEIRNLNLKRTYEVFDGKLIKYFNNDIQLDESEIITDKIEKRTGGVLEDIIETIQQDQMDIIEADPRQVCIVQGCVGSGKSTVAIHKLAHIFFNFPNYIRAERAILVAKNQILVGYLSTLFPKLGIFDINFKTLRDLVVNVIFREDLNITVDMDAEQDTSYFDLEFIKKLDRYIESVHKSSEEKVKHIFDDPELESFGGYKYSEKLTPIANISEILGDLNEELDAQNEAYKDNPKSVRALMYRDNIRNIRTLIRKLNTLKAEVRDKMLTNLFKELHLNTDKKLTYAQTLLYLHIYSKVVGFTKFQPYEYCVVDEGQDFSLLEYAVLSQFVLRGRFGIFGDLNQSLEDDGVSSWDDIKEVIFEAKTANVFELRTNFRSTKPIIDLANKILAPFATEFLPKSINRKGSEPKIVTYAKAEDMFMEFAKDIQPDIDHLDKSVGVICFDDETLHIAGSYLKDQMKDSESLIKLDASKKISYIPKGIYYMNPFDCKGLEFGKVYILGLNLDKIKDYSMAKRAFVAVTRAMNELHIYGIR